MKKDARIAIIGATGAVGTELLSIIKLKGLPHASLTAFASERSVGTEHEGHQIMPLEELVPKALEYDIVFGCADADVSRQIGTNLQDAWVTAGKRSVFIDNSTAFRGDSNIPLVVPELNGSKLHRHHSIIASPNCTATIASMALRPIHRWIGITRIVAVSFQAVSGAGHNGNRALEHELTHPEGLAPESPFPHRIAGNVIPLIGDLDHKFNSGEEEKFRDEVRKILGIQTVPIGITCVRVPVRRAHSISLSVEVERTFSPNDLEECFMGQDGLIRFADDRPPTPLDVEGRDACYVGRVRDSRAFPNKGIDLWVTGDQIRKGAALNVFQIAERLLMMDIVR